MPPRQSGRIRAVATVVAAACLLGADFGRPDPDSFSLGQTTEQEIRERFGEPANRFNGRVGDKPITVLRYQYAEPRSTEILARAMSYTFHEGRLVGYDYSSSFAADRTNFDGAAAKRIRRGQSTRTDVLDLAGKPTGEFIYPAPHAPRPNQRAYVYSFAHSSRVPATRTLDTTSRVLVVVFDEHDVVVQTSLVSTEISAGISAAPSPRTPGGNP
jgi:hypothetical protein